MFSLPLTSSYRYAICSIPIVVELEGEINVQISVENNNKLKGSLKEQQFGRDPSKLVKAHLESGTLSMGRPRSHNAAHELRHRGGGGGYSL